MSRIEEMLRELCPDGVEYRPLGELGVFIRGNGIQKSDFTDEGVACVHYGQIHTRFGIATDSAVTKIASEKAAKLRHVEYGDLMIAATSEDDAAVAKATTWLGAGELVIGGDAYIYRHSLDPKYVSYFFASDVFQAQKLRFVTGTKVRRISDSSLAKVRIPVPPPEIQREIVRILDSFTELEAELEAELQARRKQVSLLRSSLLAADNLVELGEVSSFQYGLTAKASSFGSYRLIRITDILEGGHLSSLEPVFVEIDVNQEKYKLKFGDILVARTGASYGKTVQICSMRPSVFASFLIRVQLDETRLLSRFYWHFAQSRLYWDQAKRLVSTGGQPQFNSGAISRIQVPLPPLDVQRRIADVLDSFDALVNDLSSGLPAEIEARRTQYEHYRDKLLSFPEKK